MAHRCARSSVRKLAPFFFLVGLSIVMMFLFYFIFIFTSFLLLLLFNIPACLRRLAIREKQRRQSRREGFDSG